MDCSSPVFPVLHYLQSLLKFMSVESVMLSNHLILCCPLLLLPSVFPSSKVFTYCYQLVIKDTTQKPPNGSTHSAGYGRRGRSFDVISEHTILLAPPWFTSQECLHPDCHVGIFMEASLCDHDCLNGWPLIMGFICSPSPVPQWSEGGAVSSNPLFMPGSFWQPASILKPFSKPAKASLERKMILLLGKFQGI